MLSSKAKVRRIDLTKRIHPKLYLYNQPFIEKHKSPQKAFMAATEKAYEHYEDQHGVIHSSTTTQFNEYLKELYGGKIPKDIRKASLDSLKAAKDLLDVVLNNHRSKEKALERISPSNDAMKDPDFTMFNDLSSQSQQWVLNHIDWSSLSLEQQKAIWNYLSYPSVELAEKLKLIGQLTLDQSQITNTHLSLLLSRFPSLVSLSARRCCQVEGNVLAVVYNYCKNIEVVDFSHSSIGKVVEPSTIREIGLTLVNLKRLVLSNCPELTLLRTRSRLLEYVDLSHCPKLKKVHLGHEPLAHLAVLNMTGFAGELQLQVPYLPKNNFSFSPSYGLTMMEVHKNIGRSGMCMVFAENPLQWQLDPSMKITRETASAFISIILLSSVKMMPDNLAIRMIEILHNNGFLKPKILLDNVYVIPEFNSDNVLKPDYGIYETFFIGKNIIVRFGHEPKDWHGLNLRGANIPNADFSGMDLSGTDLSNATLCHAILDETTFSDANLEGVIWGDWFKKTIDNVKSISISSDSKLIASASSDGLEIYTIKTGKRAKAFEDNTEFSNQVAFSNDNQLLATAHPKALWEGQLEHRNRRRFYRTSISLCMHSPLWVDQILIA